MLNNISESVWQHEDELPHYEVVRESIELMNRQEQAELVTELQNSIRYADSNLPYSHIRSRGDSKESALVVSSPFANGLQIHRLALSGLLHESARRAGIHDHNGDYLPVITVASKQAFDGVKTTGETYKNPIEAHSSETIDIIKKHNIGRVALLGFSQGADISLSTSLRATEGEFDPPIIKKQPATSFSVEHVAVGEPASVKQSGKRKLRSDFTKAGLVDLNREIKAGGLNLARESYTRLPGSAVALARFAVSTQTRTNRLMFESLAGERSYTPSPISLARFVLPAASVSLAYGSESTIFNRQAFEDRLKLAETTDEHMETKVVTAGSQHLTSPAPETATRNFSFHRFEGRNHAMGDNAALMTAFYLADMPAKI